MANSKIVNNTLRQDKIRELCSRFFVLNKYDIVPVQASSAMYEMSHIQDQDKRKKAADRLFKLEESFCNAIMFSNKFSYSTKVLLVTHGTARREVVTFTLRLPVTKVLETFNEEVESLLNVYDLMYTAYLANTTVKGPVPVFFKALHEATEVNVFTGIFNKMSKRVNTEARLVYASTVSASETKEERDRRSANNRANLTKINEVIDALNNLNQCIYSLDDIQKQMLNSMFLSFRSEEVTAITDTKLRIRPYINELVTDERFISEWKDREIARLNKVVSLEIEVEVSGNSVTKPIKTKRGE